MKFTFLRTASSRVCLLPGVTCLFHKINFDLRVRAYAGACPCDHAHIPSLSALPHLCTAWRILKKFLVSRRLLFVSNARREAMILFVLFAFVYLKKLTLILSARALDENSI
jgi:hypothetical protein